MLDAVDQAPAWEKGEEVSPHDIKDLYIKSGMSLVFWSSAEPLKEMTEEEKARLKKPAYNPTSTYSSSYSSSSYSTSSVSSWHHKERGIKIHVDEDSDDDENATDAAKKSDQSEASSAATPAAASAAAESSPSNETSTMEIVNNNEAQ